jgi:hypothetical protein
MLESYNTYTYKEQSQPNKTDFYQQALANSSIYRNGLVKPEMEVFTSHFRTFTALLW